MHESPLRYRPRPEVARVLPSGALAALAVTLFSLGLGRFAPAGAEGSGAPGERPEVDGLRDPAHAAFTLLGIADQRGIGLQSVAVARDGNQASAWVEVRFHSELWKIAPFLYLARGSSLVRRTPEGRALSIEVPLSRVGAPGSSGFPYALSALLDRPGLSERRFELSEGAASGDHFELSARGGPDLAMAVAEGVRKVLGDGSVAYVQLEHPRTPEARFTVGGTLARPPGAWSARSGEGGQLDSWSLIAELARTRGTGPFRAHETRAGKILWTRDVAGHGSGTPWNVYRIPPREGSDPAGGSGIPVSSLPSPSDDPTTGAEVVDPGLVGFGER